MKNFKVLNLIHIVEKALNIHRDYLFLKKKQRNFVTFMILLEVIVFVPVIIDNLKYISAIHKYNFFIYCNMTSNYLLYMLQSTFILLISPRLGHKCRILQSSIANSHAILKSHPEYNKSLLYLELRNKMAIFIVTLVRITMTVGMIIFSWASVFYMLERISIYSHILYFAVTTWVDGRYVVIMLLFRCMLAIIRSMLQTVNAMIKETDASTIKENLSNCVTVYRQLLESSRQLKECFGPQVSIINVSMLYVLTNKQSYFLVPQLVGPDSMI